MSKFTVLEETQTHTLSENSLDKFSMAVCVGSREHTPGYGADEVHGHGTFVLGDVELVVMTDLRQQLEGHQRRDLHGERRETERTAAPHDPSRASFPPNISCSGTQIDPEAVFQHIKTYVMNHFLSLHTDLGEDAGSGGHSAVHHAVEDGEQAVQRKRLRPQEVVTRLQK